MTGIDQIRPPRTSVAGVISSMKAPVPGSIVDVTQPCALPNWVAEYACATWVKL